MMEGDFHTGMNDRRREGEDTDRSHSKALRQFAEPSVPSGKIAKPFDKPRRKR